MNDLIKEFQVYKQVQEGLSKNTIKNYGRDINELFKYLKQNKNIIITAETIQHITKKDLEMFIAYIADKGNSKTTRSRKISSIKEFFKYLHEEERIIENNPAITLKNPKLDKKLPVYLKLNEAKRLLDAVEGKHKERDYAILTLFLNCGLRLSELVNINIDDLKDNMLRIRNGKGSKDRDIILNDIAIKAVKDYLEVRLKNKGEKALFLSNRNKRISTRNVQEMVKKYIEKAKLNKKYSVHKLRHTCASLLHQNGVDIRDIQELLGHEDLSTTSIYTHLNKEKMKKAVAANPLNNI